MLRRSAIVLNLDRISFRRSYSYHSKVRAIPFGFSKEAAIRHVAVAASAGCLFRDFLGSFGAKYIGGNFQPIQPIRIQPVYFPAWFLDTEVESHLNDHDERQRIVTAYFNNCYLPGAAFDLLGRLALRDDQVDPSLAIPFSQNLTHQHGCDIICMPYTISPFDLFSRARASSFIQAIDEDARFELRSIKTNIEAAYPVLIPLYLAQFPMVQPFESSTFVIEAYNNRPGRFFIQLSHPSELPEEDHFDLEKIVGQDYLSLGDNQSSHAEARVLTPNFNKSASANVASWFSELFSELNGAEKLVHPNGAAGVNMQMDDPRVREWIVEEVNSIREWMNQGQAIVQLKDVVENLTSIENQMQNGSAKVTQWPPPPNPKQGLENVIAGLEAFIKVEMDKLQKLEKSRADSAPEWWRQREETQAAKWRQ